MILKVSGDLGDLAFCMCLVRNVPNGPHTLRIVDSEFMPNSPPFLPRFRLIEKVVAAQPYIKDIKIGPGRADLDLLRFRERMDRTKTLTEAQIEEAELLLKSRIPRDTSPWISGIEPHSYSYGRVVISRTHRYRNSMFPWKDVVKNLGHRLLFIGSREEHRDFENHFGWVEYCPTPTLYEAAELIKGSDLFIGNQSSPMALAIGMGHQSVQEVSPVVPDCIFPRDNIQYVTDRGFDLEGKHYGPVEVDLSLIRTFETPPGQWQWEKERRFDLDDLVKFFWLQDKSVDKKHLRNKILIANVLRQKGFFNPPQAMSVELWQEAFSNAGIPYKS